jgi:hypothetical protein
MALVRHFALFFAQDLFGKPVSTPDRVRGKAFSGSCVEQSAEFFLYFGLCRFGGADNGTRLQKT